MRKILDIVFRLSLMLLAASAVVFAQGQIAPREPLRLTMDCSRFRGPDDTTAQLEVYYSFPQAGLTYLPDSAGYKGVLDITLTAKKKDSLFYQQRWLAPHVVSDTAMLIKGMNLVSLQILQLPAGEYVFKMVASDAANESRHDSVTFRMPVRPVGQGKVMLSDVEFASIIRRAEQKTVFYKNKIEVRPNVGGLYGENQQCFYYAEAYNLLAGEDKGDYVLRSSVFDAVGREVLNWDRPQKRKYESSVILDTVSIRNLKTGTYTLLLSVLDSTRKTLTSSGKKFYVYNSVLGLDSSLQTSTGSLPLNIYATMDEPELDDEWKQTKYEALPDEQSQYNSLKGVDAKRKFLTNFWRRRPTGMRETYMARVAYANQNFHMMGRPGYRTDRGRVYITYGPPDDYERHPNESEYRPYEVWTYNSIQGGVEFDFVLRSPGGDYELVNSTHRNELHDANWQRYLTLQ
jgi:GWxTD domain-containing protein